MGLFDLVKKHHGIGLAADLLRQLSGLVITHIARRGTHDPGDGVLLHKLGHIQPNQGIRRVEQVICQLLDQLRLAHAGSAHKDETHRLMLGADAHPVAPHGGGHARFCARRPQRRPVDERLRLRHELLLGRGVCRLRGPVRLQVRYLGYLGRHRQRYHWLAARLVGPRPSHPRDDPSPAGLHHAGVLRQAL